MWMFCGWVWTWIPVKRKKKNQKERKKKKVHTARGGRERADGPGRVEVLSCRRADGRADMWARGCGRL